MRFVRRTVPAALASIGLVAVAQPLFHQAAAQQLHLAGNVLLVSLRAWVGSTDNEVVSFAAPGGEFPGTPDVLPGEGRSGRLDAWFDARWMAVFRRYGPVRVSPPTGS
ncbi:MAG: hypothetical protein HXY20_14065 [Acidobacteria bacterium]|nr:hypothetical protein [Acidobacteriota bacterium]